MHRRHFVTAASFTAAALARPVELAAQTVASSGDEPRVIPRYPQDAWFDKVPGKHRLFMDATDADEAAGALGYAWNFMRTSMTGYNLKDADQAVVIGLRHEATTFAFSNDLFRKYPLFGGTKYKHPESGKKIKGGNIYRPGSTKPESYPDAFTFDGLASRGVHFAICGVALRGAASQIAGKGASREDVEKVADELYAGLPANAHVMVSGILAAQRAGEYGYTVIRG